MYTAGCLIYSVQHTLYYTSSFARFARSATSPSFAYVSNPVPDSSLCRAAAPRAIASIRFNCSGPACIRFSCCSPLASASAAARRLRPLQLLLSIASVSTASRLRPLRLLLPDCVRFNSAPRWRPLRLLLPDCVRFNCCSSIAPASAAAPRQLFWKIPAMSGTSTILEHSTQSSRFKYEGRASL